MERFPIAPPLLAVTRAAAVYMEALKARNAAISAAVELGYPLRIVGKSAMLSHEQVREIANDPKSYSL